MLLIFINLDVQSSGIMIVHGFQPLNYGKMINLLNMFLQILYCLKYMECIIMIISWLHQKQNVSHNLKTGALCLNGNLIQTHLLHGPEQTMRAAKVPRLIQPLESPSVKYQVLNLNEENRVVFSQYNGMYVFKVIIVDTNSYCVTTIFSVYVYGAFPKSQINVVGMLNGILILVLGSILMGFFFPKLLHLDWNAKTKSL